MKYEPLFEKIVEVGCGLGRYVFLLKEIDIDIEGLEFFEETIKLLNSWKIENEFDVCFKAGDVTEIPYKDKSLSSYLYFGVI